MLPVSGLIEVHAPFELTIYDRSKTIGAGTLRAVRGARRQDASSRS